MNTLEIIFTGIVYLLGTADPAGGGHVQAILPAVTAPVAPYGEVIPEHTAYIKVKESELVAPKPTPTFKYKLGPSNDEYWVFALGILPQSAGDAITIKPAVVQPDKLTICKADPCLNDRLRYDTVVAHREEICPKCGPIDDAFTKSPLAALVAARMDITHGYLAAAKRTGGGNWHTWHIKPAKGPGIPIKEQELTDKVSLDLTAATPFSIVVTALDDPNNVRYDIRLTATAKVEIGNTPVTDIVLPPRPHGELVDHHFGLFYTMLQSVTPSNPPVPTWPPHMPHATLGPRDNCPPLADEKGN